MAEVLHFSHAFKNKIQHIFSKSLPLSIILPLKISNCVLECSIYTPLQYITALLTAVFTGRDNELFFL